MTEAISTVTTVSTGFGPVEVSVTSQGSGRPVLLLHGGAGPQSVAGFGTLLATAGVQAVTPTHPGFGGTPRPAALDSVGGLAQVYAGLLDTLDLTDVTVVGSSLGGWIAAELALLGSPRVSRLVVLDAVGLELPAHPIVDFFALTMAQVTELSFADPDRFLVDVDAMPEPAKRVIAGNRAALLTYGGTTMCDPTLLGRLPGVAVPTLVVWGRADRIADAEHGRAYSAAIPGARFELIEDAGHLPQLEAPDRLASEVRAFIDAHVGSATR